MEVLAANYHLGWSHIWKILRDPDEPDAIKAPSLFYLKTVKQNENIHPLPGKDR
jgi:hypothetical protein